MKHPFLDTLFAIAVVCGGASTWLACSDDSSVKETPVPTSTGTVPPLPDAGTLPDGGAKDCYDPPLDTHFKIINACTASNVTRLEKNPVLPKLLPDGGLPPLQ